MALTLLLAALVTGAAVYCVLALIASWRYLQVKPPRGGPTPPLSVLKPLYGAEPALEANLRTFFEQQYPEFELLFGVREESDGAVPAVRRLMAAYPQVPATLVLTGQPPYANAKIFSLESMKRVCSHSLLVMSDSDISVAPGFLHAAAAEFADPQVALATMPYRAIPGPSFWTRLEALSINTQFFSGVLTARLLEGMKFALGPTIAARREALDAIGGFEELQQYLAEDFVMGNRLAALGRTGILSSAVVDHHIGSQSARKNFEHRLRWNRSTRRSRPAGYVGELFTHPLVLAAMLFAWDPRWWPLAAAAALLRFAAGFTVAGAVLSDRRTVRLFWLWPLSDLAAFLLWAAGFFGKHIVWRGRRYLLRKDGRFEPA